MKLLSLLLSLIPFLTNLYVTKYLHDIKENNHCKNIDSTMLTLYYDFYITSTIILFVSIIGVILAINKYTDLFKIGIFKKFLDLLSNNKKIFNILSIVFSFGLVKLIHDLRKEPSCDKIDHNIATNIYYYSIVGVVMGLFNLFGVKLY
tara:strand:+ start:539 stop:982 length:444 start_codon:yes stop_codon:yes gene_type:complete